MAFSRYGNGVPNGPSAATNGYHTVTALSRWSITNNQLPAAEKIGALHVYDFDNTLFQTPLPNGKIWNPTTIGQLGSPDIFVNGGWWHDSRILAATGEGVDREEPRGWQGCWNEKIVELVRLSMQQKDALCVLLTGRSERGFSDLIKRIVKSKGLEFDMIGLKPEVGPNSERFRSTMLFKQAFLEAMMETYKHAQDLRIYEDRSKHVAGFRDFFREYNQRQQGLHGSTTRGPISAEVIQVADISTSLDPVVEVAEIQHLINSHNAIVTAEPSSDRNKQRMIIRKTVFFTGYLLQPDDTKKLLALAAPSMPKGNDIKIHANCIMIVPRACSKPILDKVGGMNAKMQWQAVKFGSWDNGIWAIAVKPYVANATYYTEQPTPMVVLATRRNTKPSDAHKIHNWESLPSERAHVFETTVGEKTMLRIEPEDAENEDGSLLPYKGKRKFAGDDDRGPRHFSGGSGGNRGFHSSSRGGNSRGGHRGNNSGRGYRGGGRGGKGSGRGGRGGYRSLDDVGTRDNSSGGFGANGPVSYDDSFPSLPQGPQRGGGHQSQPSFPPQHQMQQQSQWGGGGGSSGGPVDFQNLY